MLGDGVRRCDECRRTVPSGEPYRHVYLQEAEACRDCEYGDCECADCCQCQEPSVGETFDWYCCNDCLRFLRAIETAEIDAGCARHEAQPAYGAMMEELQNAGPADTKRYYQRASQLFPDMGPYLAWLWRQLYAGRRRRWSWRRVQ